MSQAKTKKIFSIASKVLTWIIIAVAVFMMIFTIFSTLTFNKNDRNLFGIRFYVVLTDSMSPSENNKDDKIHFDSGDIVLIKNVDDPTELEAGDVIAFISQNSDSFGETVTHRIRERTTTEEGKLAYRTYGTNTGTNDQALVEPEYVLGKYAGKIPNLGHFFDFLKTTPGYIVCILVPFLLLILWQGVNTVRLFRRYRQEQMADMKAEREKLAEEREESVRMMRELQALREQLANAAGAAPAANPAPTVPENTTNTSADNIAPPSETVKATESAENTQESDK